MAAENITPVGNNHEGANTSPSPWENLTSSPDETILAQNNESFGYRFKTFYVFDYTKANEDLNNAAIFIYFTDRATKNPYSVNRCYGEATYFPGTPYLQSVRMSKSLYPGFGDISPEVEWSQRNDLQGNPLGWGALVNGEVPARTFTPMMSRTENLMTFMLHDSATSIIKAVTLPPTLLHSEVLQAALDANPGRLNGRVVNWRRLPELFPVSLTYNRCSLSIDSITQIPPGTDGILTYSPDRPVQNEPTGHPILEGNILYEFYTNTSPIAEIDGAILSYASPKEEELQFS